jgi:hypothetical protein
MTTIACNRDMMAADSLVTCGSQRNYQTSKIWRHGRSIFGAAGDSKAIAAFRRWIGSYAPGWPAMLRGLADAGFADGADFSALELRDDGIYIWDSGLFPDRLEDEEQNYAIGSIGAGVALYCMRVLHDGPVKAVTEACRVCTESGPPVRWMKLNGEEGEAHGDQE